MEFELTPASSGTVVSLWLICAMLVGTALMFVLVAWSAAHGMPGYAAGWYKLASGSKALLAVTRGPVLFIPTSEGYSLAVSVAHPEVALQQLRSAGG